MQYEEHIPIEVRIQSLDIALKVTPTRWWGTHKMLLQVWDQVKRMFMLRFTKQMEIACMRYIGKRSPYSHIDHYVTMWKDKHISEEEWVHRFVHTLDVVPTNWYIQELRCSMETWPKVVEYFLHTFSFESEDILWTVHYGGSRVIYFSLRVRLACKIYFYVSTIGLAYI